MHETPSERTRDLLRKNFLAQTLRIQTISPTGQVEWRPLERVSRSPGEGRQLVRVRTHPDTRWGAILTADHRVYTSPTDRIEAGLLRRGDQILAISGDRPQKKTVLWVEPLPPRRYMYNLSVPPHRNYMVCSFGVVANSPDTFYHFRPPEHEGRVGKYDRVFGQIWQDQELLLYLNRAIDDWTLVPPNTSQVRTIDEIWSRYPGWRSGVTWGAIVHALFAVQLNWIADEFDYSIGGVSLSIEKSSKYQSALGDAKERWDRAAEGKTRTTLYIMGLKQSRFGTGVRSAFGPALGKNTLSPRAYVWGFLIPLLAAKYYTLENIFSVIWS